MRGEKYGKRHKEEKQKSSSAKSKYPGIKYFQEWWTNRTQRVLVSILVFVLFNSFVIKSGHFFSA